jgi:hypothetical protein
MLGTRDPQRDLFGAAARLAPELEKLGFYGRLAAEGSSIFRDHDFARCYSDIGRPSAPPSLVALAHLLQHYEGISDEEVIERLKYDIRWKVALDLEPLTIVAPFAKSTFQAFRLRLTLHEKEGIAFERSLKKARDAGVLPKKLCIALDSSPVRGRGAVKDTFNLLSDAVRAVVRALAAKRETNPAEEAARIGVERHFQEASIKGSEVVDWTDAAAVSGFLAGLLADCDRAVQAAKRSRCASEQVALLEKVIDQDVDRNGDDGPAIKREVAPGRTVSIADPEMRHGHKSTGKIYSGHKAHVAVETTTEIITALDVTAPSISDGAKVGELIQATEQSTKSDVNDAIGDSAYSSREAIAQASAEGVELTTKMPKPPKGRFGPRDFTVSKDRETVKCPAGHASAKTVHRSDGEIEHHWSADLCGPCPLRARCTNADARQLKVAVDHHDRRKRERAANTEAGRAKLRRRMAAEHAIGRMKNLGAGVSRFFGRAKTRVQWFWTAAVANLTRTWVLADAREGRWAVA